MKWIAGLVLSVALAAGQSISLSNGVNLRIETSLGRPTGTQAIHAALEPASGNSFYRIFRDQNGLAVFCYELAVDKGSTTTFRLTARPAGQEFAAKFPRADGGKPTPTISEPRSLGLVHSGESVSFEAFETPGAGVKAVDTIHFTLGDQPEPAGGDSSIRLAGLRVTVNGRPLRGPSDAGVSGRYAMFYIPGLGAYFLTTRPVAGRPFVSAGWVDGRRMQFTLDNETIECTSSEPFLAKSQRGEVWAYHVGGYRPLGEWTQPLDAPPGKAPEFFAAASDSLGWWLAEPAAR